LDISNLGVLGGCEERLEEISTDPGSFSISDVGKWPKMALARAIWGGERKKHPNPHKNRLIAL
jgi:hypothetical protein